MKKFLEIPQRTEEDYHYIKNDIPLERKKRKQIAKESRLRIIIIKKKKQSTPLIPPPGDDKERDAIAEAILLSLTLHKTTLDAEAKEHIAKVQEKLDEEEIEKMVEGEEDEESYTSAFTDSVFNEDVDDTGSKIELESHKKNPENVDDDDEHFKNENKDEEVEKEKEDEVDTEKVIVDDVMRSQEIRKEQKQTTITSPNRSPRNVSSFEKIVFKELTATVSPTIATTSKDSSTIKHKKRFFSNKTRFYQELLLECVEEKEMLRLTKLAVDKDLESTPVNILAMVSKEFATHGPKRIEDLFQKHMQNTTLNLYPTTSSLIISDYEGQASRSSS
uniref:Uncharacterized protein n=1 Tax=Tanacetum cinerariifolium TaxID=118510 RepID=A0A6L2LPK7_TANCI|nr:hypothetical protein [Tanacetum cinerariifolium]